MPAEALPEVETPEVLERRVRELKEAEKLEVERMELEVRKRSARLDGARWSTLLCASVVTLESANNCGKIVSALRDIGLDDVDVALQVVCYHLVRTQPAYRYC